MLRRRISPWTSIVVIGVILALVSGGSYLYLQRLAPPLMSLEEALWTCDAPIQEFFPPGSPESAAVIQGLASQGIDTKAKEYRSYLCLRLLDPGAPPNVAAAWSPFDPEDPWEFIRVMSLD